MLYSRVFCNDGNDIYIAHSGVSQFPLLKGEEFYSTTIIAIKPNLNPNPQFH